MLKKCFISHAVGNDSSSYVKFFCLVTTELMMGWTVILLHPGWAALEELMSRVRTIFWQLRKSQRKFWAGTNKLLVLTTELCQRHLGTPGFHIALILPFRICIFLYQRAFFLELRNCLEHLLSLTLMSLLSLTYKYWECSVQHVTLV